MHSWQEVHQKYAQLIHSEQIATPKALRIITSRLKNFSKCDTVIIEIGIGIGTIAELILKQKDFFYLALERDKFCRDQIANNLYEFKIHLTKTYQELVDFIEKIDSKARSFVVIDDYIDLEETLELVEVLIKKFQYIEFFIEGHRFRQRRYLLNALRQTGSYFQAHFFGNSRDSAKGGFLVCFNSNKVMSVMFMQLQIKRLEIQSSLISRKVLQFFGIRKRRFLNYRPRLSKRS
jgi:hypothetical protein